MARIIHFYSLCRRQFSMASIMLAILILLGACCLGQTAPTNNTKQNTKTIVVGQIGFTGRTKLGNEICRVANGNGMQLKMGPETNGSKDNAELVQNGGANFGLIQADLDLTSSPGIRSLMFFNGNEFIQLYISDEVKANAAKNRNGHALEELKRPSGKRRKYTIETGAVGSGSKMTSKYKGFLAYHGLRADIDYISDNQSYADIVNRCKEGKPLDDAYFFVATPVSEVGAALYSTGKYSLVSFDGLDLGNLQEQNPQWKSGTIPVGRVSSQQLEPVQTVEIPLRLIAGPTVSADVEAQLMNALRSSDFAPGAYKPIALTPATNQQEDRWHWIKITAVVVGSVIVLVAALVILKDFRRHSF